MGRVIIGAIVGVVLAGLAAAYAPEPWLAMLRATDDTAPADGAPERPAVVLRMASWYPSDLAQLGTLGRGVADKVARMSDGGLRIDYLEPGAAVPPRRCFDAVSSGEVDACWSSPGFWRERDPAFALFSSVPFGPRAAEYGAWLYYGGGRELMAELYAPHNIHSLTCGVIAPEASGWFKREIATVEDLAGLRMRFFGLGAEVMERLGVRTELIPGGEVLAALEEGRIDAAEYSMPAIDLDLGFEKVARHYYFPGWHQPATLFEIMVNKDKWESLTGAQRAMVETACGDAFRQGLTESGAAQLAALESLRDKGVQFHRWPPAILERLAAAWNEVAAEEAARSESFRKVWQSYTAFRDRYRVWNDLAYLD